MRQALIALRLFIFMTLLTGVAYPIFVTVVSQTLFSKQAGGSLVDKDGAQIGSLLIAQKFESDRYLWARPSAIDYKPLPSGGSNWGPSSQDLVKQVKDREVALRAKSINAETPPQDLLFASGSGLDPEISVEAARYQLARLEKSRGIDISALRSLLSQMTQDRQWSILGEPRVNVLRFNLALDHLQR